MAASPPQRHILWLLLVCLTLSGLILSCMDVCGQSAAQTPAQNPTDYLSRYLDEAAGHQDFEGNVLIAQDGGVVFKKSYGYQNEAQQIPLTDSTQFPLASISKTFTAVAILQLRDKGRLKLDDHFVKYFPDFPYPAITIRQLLSHTSGLPDTESLLDSLVKKYPDRIFTNADDLLMLDYYSKTRRQLLAPGAKWSYSSTGYQLLALLVQKLSRESFPAYLKKHIFIPAGMNSTYVQTSLDQAREPNRTTNYIYNNHYEMKLQWVDTVLDRREWIYNVSGQVGAGNVVSTAGDLLSYDRALYGGVLLKPSTLEEAFTPVKLSNGQDNEAVPGTSYGLGWFIFRDTTHGKMVWHSGSTPGIVTLYVRNISTHQVYILLSNVVYGNRIYRDLLDMIKGKPVVYRQSLGFQYAQDAFRHGIDYAIAHLYALKKDTTDYILTEADMDRAGLEFSRDWQHGQPLALETYKIMTLLYPNDEHIYKEYADLLVNGRVKNREAAMLLYQKALALEPGDKDVKAILVKLEGG